MTLSRPSTTFVADPQGTLVAADGVLVADVRPATDLHLGTARGGLNFYALAQRPCRA